MNLCILGAGAWGTTLALHLHRLGHTVTLVPRRMEHALELSSARENRDYLPGFDLPHDIQIGAEAKPVLMEAEAAILACPTAGLREACERIREARESSWQLRLIVVLSKGLELEKLLSPTEVVREVLPDYEVGALCGPTFAGEVAEGKPTAITLATSRGSGQAHRFQEAISGNGLRVYWSDDLRGVELGACLKNIYAIASGICQGLGLGDNARAALLTRSLAEMVRLGMALGADPQTFMGLSGAGDLVATCYGEWSRNRTFGEKIGKGEQARELISQGKTVTEGYWATQAMLELCEKTQVDAPILREVHAVLYEDKPPREALGTLLARNLKKEAPGSPARG